MHPAARVIAVAVLAAVSLTCVDRTVTGARLGQFALLAITPVFDDAPEGGPDIDVRRIRGQLTRLNGSDSIMTEALVEGDSAILEFTNVTVRGDSTAYQLGIEAFDAEDELVFKASQIVKVMPGDNEPVTAGLQYVAPDKHVDALEIKVNGTPVDSVQLDWAGADPSNTLCLNRATKAGAVTQQQLDVRGTADGQAIANVRVGYRARDPSVVSVDSTGLVKARCSNKSTYVVARTFLNVVDSVKVNVTAPPFSLIMSPDSVILERGASRQLNAVLVDENNNETTVAAVTWGSSDATRATVTGGLVQAIRNGRVIITASFGNRTTVGIVQVVRPKAASVKVMPLNDSVGFGRSRHFFARALDASGRVIGDAVDFTWASSNTAAATIGPNGFALAKTVEDVTTVSASIDGKTGSTSLYVVPALPPGTIVSKVKDASTDAPLAGASISVSGGSPVSSAGDGSFVLTGVKEGDDMTISKTGYVSVTFYDAPAFPNKTVQIPAVPLSPTSGSPGTMNGKVVNALTGNGVKDITIKAYAGLHSAPSPRNPNPTLVATTTSISDGTFTMNAPAGSYTFVASGTGYSEANGVGTSVGGATKFTPPIIQPPAVAGGGVYVVLTWDDCVANPLAPCNLDAHLTGPKSSVDPTRFQVFSANTSYIDVDTIAALYVEKSAGKGPEVLGLGNAATPGIYRLYVKDVTNAGNAASLALADNSGARVDIFQNNRVIASFLPPPGQAGTLWEAFHYDGARIIPINQISTPADPAILAIRAAPPSPTRLELTKR